MHQSSRLSPSPCLIDNDSEGGRRTDTSLFTVRVPSQGVFSTEPGRDGTLFEGVHDGVRRSCNRRGQVVVQFCLLLSNTWKSSRGGLTEELFQDNPHSYFASQPAADSSDPQFTTIEKSRQILTSQDFGKEEQLSRLVQSAGSLAVVRILQPSDLSGFASRSALGRPRTRGTCQSVVFRVRRLDRTLLDP